MQVTSAARRAGVPIILRDLFQHPKLEDLARAALEGPPRLTARGVSSRPAPLAPMQADFLARQPVDPHHDNQAVLLEARESVDRDALGRALAALIAHHDALRLRFLCRGRRWRQVALPAVTDGLRVCDLSDVSSSERIRALEAEAARVQETLDPLHGRMARGVLFELGPRRPPRVLLAVHHLGVDRSSWPILLDDLETAYAQARAGREIGPPLRTTSFVEWSRRLAAHARSPEVTSEIAHWLSAAARDGDERPPHSLGEPGRVGDERRLELNWDAEATRVLLEGCAEAGLHPQDVLLTALVRTFADGAGSARFQVDLRGHGREEVEAGLDVTRTVGWFTTLYPVVLETPAGSGPARALASVARTLRAVPGRGARYGLLRHCRGDGALARRLAMLRRSDVSFSYGGRVRPAAVEGGAFLAAKESPGPLRSPRSSRRHALALSARLEDGALKVAWAHAAAQTSRVEGLARRFAERVGELVSCLPAAGGGSRPFC